MAKPTLLDNLEGIKYFYSILQGNKKLSEIIEFLDIKTKRSMEEINNKQKVITTNAITEKLTTLKEYGVLEKEGMNKGTKYYINYKGIILLILDLIKSDIESNSSILHHRATTLNMMLNEENITNELSNSKDIQLIIKGVFEQYFKEGLVNKSLNDVFRDIIRFIGVKGLNPLESLKKPYIDCISEWEHICSNYYIVLEDNPLIHSLRTKEYIGNTEQEALNKIKNIN